MSLNLRVVSIFDRRVIFLAGSLFSSSVNLAFKFDKACGGTDEMNVLNVTDLTSVLVAGYLKSQSKLSECAIYREYMTPRDETFTVSDPVECAIFESEWKCLKEAIGFLMDTTDAYIAITSTIQRILSRITAGVSSIAAAGNRAAR